MHWLGATLRVRLGSAAPNAGVTNAERLVMAIWAANAIQIRELDANKNPTAHIACIRETKTRIFLRSNLSTVGPPNGVVKNDGRVNAT